MLEDLDAASRFPPPAYDPQPTVLALDHRAGHGAVLGEVVLVHQAAMLLRVEDDGAGQLPTVQDFRAVRGDQPEGSGEGRLAEEISLGVRRSVRFEEVLPRSRIALKGLPVPPKATFEALRARWL